MSSASSSSRLMETKMRIALGHGQSKGNSNNAEQGILVFKSKSLLVRQMENAGGKTVGMDMAMRGWFVFVLQTALMSPPATLSACTTHQTVKKATNPGHLRFYPLAAKPG